MLNRVLKMGHESAKRRHRRHHHHLHLLIIAIVFSHFILAAHAFDFIQFIFGPRLQNRFVSSFRRSLNFIQDHNDQVRAIASKFGYPLEVHEVLTADGYYVTMHRLPSNNYTHHPRKPREAVLIQPGFFGSSESFMFRGPKNDLTYSLLEAGYDVWLANPRGSHHSRKHQIYDPNVDAAYWNFSYHEIGIYDLAANIDHILKVTRRKTLFFIGYSMGATAGYVLLSERPEYNAKLKFVANLAGIGVVDHRLQPHLKVMMDAIPVLTALCKRSNVFELFPRRELIADLLKTICRDGSPLQSVCLSIMHLISGQGKQIETLNIPYIFTYFPSGSSINTMLHYYQTYTTGHFGPLINYTTSTPHRQMDYNLSRITVPVSMHYGPSDYLNTEQDNIATANQLKNVVGIFRVPFPQFNHMDFMWGKDAKKLLYDQLLLLMDKFR